jgi:hypothetical protein
MLFITSAQAPPPPPLRCSQLIYTQSQKLLPFSFDSSVRREMEGEVYISLCFSLEW